MSSPTLLLRPGYSRNAAGTVTPTATSAPVVGDDWQIAAGGSVVLTLSGEITAAAGTLALWFQPGSANWYGKSAYCDLLKAQAVANHLTMYRNNNAAANFVGKVAAATVAFVHGKAAGDTSWVFLTLEWTGSAASLYVDNALAQSVAAGTPSVGATITLGGADAVNVSSAMVFDGPLSDAERTALFATQDWTFDMLQARSSIAGIGLSLRMGL